MPSAGSRALAERIESENLRLQEHLETMAADLERNRADRVRVDLQLRQIEAEARRLASRWVEVEARNAVVSNLYVAVRQLHGTLARAEVIETLREIVIGLIGSEELAVFDRSDDGSEFILLTSSGIEASEYSRLSADHDPLGKLLASGQRFISDDVYAAPAGLDVPIVAAVPFEMEGRVTGGIVLFSLLSQKTGFTDADRELFDLLATHAAIALHSTRLIDAEGAVS